jgi:arsenate reductase (glutaredoxin)
MKTTRRYQCFQHSTIKVYEYSGEQYRALKIGDRIKAGMTEQEAIALLSKNGKLIKRPFLLTAKGGTTGFQAETWDKLV